MNAKTFWESYLATLPGDHQHRQRTYSAWQFGDNAEMAGRLCALVLSGEKTATASLEWEYASDGEELPSVGEMSIVLDAANQPACIIEVTSVTIHAFDDVSAEHAYKEGEGDLTLAYWRQAHWSFFSRVCEELQAEPSGEMPIVCEEFRLVYVR